jgi:hypothetical protein
MAAGYQVWYGHQMVLTDTAARMEARDYEPLLRDMGFKFVQVMRYQPPMAWGKVMTVAQYINHKLPSKLLRIDHETTEVLREWRKKMAIKSRRKIKLVDGTVLTCFDEIRNLRCPDCNSAFGGFEYVQHDPELRFCVSCNMCNSSVNPCRVYVHIDPETMRVEVKRK